MTRFISVVVITVLLLPVAAGATCPDYGTLIFDKFNSGTTSFQVGYSTTYPILAQGDFVPSDNETIGSMALKWQAVGAGGVYRVEISEMNGPSLGSQLVAVSDNVSIINTTEGGTVYRFKNLNWAKKTSKTYGIAVARPNRELNTTDYAKVFYSTSVLGVSGILGSYNNDNTKKRSGPYDLQMQMYSSSIAPPTTYGDYSCLWDYSAGDGFSITGYTGTGTATIPATINDCLVKSIGVAAFSNISTITSVTIPSGITSIGNGAFSGCTNLYNSHFLGNAPTIGANVFANHKLGFTVYYPVGATGFTLPTWKGFLSAVETTPRTSAIWDRSTILTGLPSSVMEPSLIQPEKGHSQFFDNDTTIWKMWFHRQPSSVSAVTGIWYAESLNGVDWIMLDTAVVANHSCDFVIKNGATYYMYVAGNANTTLDLFESTDGRNWTLTHANVIPLGTAGSWNSHMIGNSGGAVVDGTLYLFLEVYGHSSIDNSTGWSIGLFTATDFYTFTPAAGNPIIVSPYDGDVGGPTAPYLIGDTWWIWTHGNPGNVDGNIEGDIYRYSAPALTGPWTRNPAGITFPRATQDAGMGSSIGETDDPHVIEVNGKTYMYYVDLNDGTTGEYAGNDILMNIKLAIANMPIAVLVMTDEYASSLFYLQFLAPKLL